MTIVRQSLEIGDHDDCRIMKQDADEIIVIRMNSGRRPTVSVNNNDSGDDKCSNGTKTTRRANNSNNELVILSSIHTIIVMIACIVAIYCVTSTTSTTTMITTSTSSTSVIINSGATTRINASKAFNSKNSDNNNISNDSDRMDTTSTNTKKDSYFSPMSQGRRRGLGQEAGGTMDEREEEQQQYNFIPRQMEEEFGMFASPPSAEDFPLFPLRSYDYFGFFFAILGLMIAAGGGIGGGGILVPIFILVMGFTPKHAIPLSNVTIVGGAIANNLINWKLRHPLADRPLIDWDLVLVMVPLTLLGALLGAFLNKILPELLLTILLVILLSVTAYVTLKKAICMYQKETRDMLACSTSEMQFLHHKENHGNNDDNKDNNNNNGKNTDNNISTNNNHTDCCNHHKNGNGGSTQNGNRQIKNYDSFTTSENGEKGLEEMEGNDDDEQERIITNVVIPDEIRIILEEERHIPVQNVMLLIGTLLIVLTVNLLKGGGAFRSPLGIQCGSRAFWLANLFLMIWIIGVAIYIRLYLVHRHSIKEIYGYKYVPGDIQWDNRTTIIYPLICCCAGFFAGMFGVGGGIITGPLILAMGVHPEVNQASSACMILFTALTALTSFIVFGLLRTDYAVICFIIGFIATYIGHEGLHYYMKKSHRNSYIAFSIGLVVFLSSILMTIQSALSLLSGTTGHSRSICSS